jgi:hypothetical protein
MQARELEIKCYDFVTQQLLADESLQLWCQPMVFYRRVPPYRDRESERTRHWQTPLARGQFIQALQQLQQQLSEMLKLEYILYFNTIVLRFSVSDDRQHLKCQSTLLYLCDEDRVKNVVAALLYSVKKADTSTVASTAEFYHQLALYLQNDAAVLFQTLARQGAG